MLYRHYVTAVFCVLATIGFIDSAKAGSISNPVPMEDDFDLPVPCGNSNLNITFRKVYTHQDLNEDDVTSTFNFVEGSDDMKRALMESKRKCSVRGGFHDDKGYFFYLSKYEITKSQYDAILSGKCSDVTGRKDSIPVTRISIDEARYAASKYSDFLQLIPETPTERKEKAIATLPYECYWSFAQRGGLLVSKETLEAQLPVFEKGEGISDYGWFFGPESANGKIQSIGLKKPNALGFFDMLGNASEYMDEPFQLTTQDGLSGQKGGSTIRGGSFRTPVSQVTNSLRSEKMLYSNNKRTVSDDTGMRLMLNVSVTHDRAYLKQITAQNEEKIRNLKSEVQSLSNQLVNSNEGIDKKELEDRIAALNAQIKELNQRSNDKDKELDDLYSEGQEIIRQNQESIHKLGGTAFLVALIGILFFITLIIIVVLLTSKHEKEKFKKRAVEKSDLNNSAKAVRRSFVDEMRGKK